MPRGFDRERTNVHKLQYHFIWCSKYRKSVLEGEVRDRLEALIEDKADELDLEILELAIRPDHVHLFITGDPTLAPNKIMQQVKGYSSRHLRDEFNLVGNNAQRAQKDTDCVDVETAFVERDGCSQELVQMPVQARERVAQACNAMCAS